MTGTFYTPYEGKTTEELEKNLANLENTCREQDAYERFARYAHRVNLKLRHDGTAPLDDVRVEILIGSVAGVEVATEEPRRPRRGYQHLFDPSLDLPKLGRFAYPTVRRHERSTSVVQEIGTVRHQAVSTVFGTPLWMLLEATAVGQRVPLTCSVHARNLPEPFRATLTLEVTQPDGTFPRPHEGACDG